MEDDLLREKPEPPKPPKPQKVIEFYELYDSSPQLIEAVNDPTRRRNDNLPNIRDKQYPFNTIEVGQSFVVSMDECNMPSLKVIVSKQKKEYKKEYFIYFHKNLNMVEVGRIK